MRLKANGNQVALEMASTQFELLIERIAAAAKQVRADIAAAKAAKDDAGVEKWEGCQQELLTVGRVAVAAEEVANGYAKLGMLTSEHEKELHGKLVEVGNKLTAIGKKYGITSLEITANKGTSFSDAERKAVLAANWNKNGNMYQCECCKFRNSQEVYDPSAPVPSGQFQVDHIIPQSKGGLGVAANGRVLDATCNSSRGNRDYPGTTGMDKDHQRAIRLHNK